MKKQIKLYGKYAAEQEGANNGNCRYPAFQENKQQIFTKALNYYDTGTTLPEIYDILIEDGVMPASVPYTHFKARFSEWKKVKREIVEDELNSSEHSEIYISRMAKAANNILIKQKIATKQRNELLKQANVIGFRELITKILKEHKIVNSPKYTKRVVSEQDETPTYIISDIHYRGTIDNEALDELSNSIRSDIETNKYTFANFVMLGDDIEGLLHKNSISNNDGAIFSALQYSKYMGKFFNDLSKTCNISINFVSAANHTQTRTLGTERNELAREDLGYVIAEMMNMSFANNANISFMWDSELCFEIGGKIIYALHGHQGYTKTPKSIESWCNANGHKIDYILIGHYHKYRIDEFGHEKTIIQAPAIKGFISDYENIAGYHLNPSYLKVTDWKNLCIKQIRLEDAK